jgi:hypothetical protein
MDTQLGARQGWRTPALHRDYAQRFDKGVESLREWNPNRPVRQMPADRDLIGESFEKQPVGTVAEA